MAYLFYFNEIEQITSLKKEIQIEIEENNEFGVTCSNLIRDHATSRDLEKFNLVVADLEPTMSLIYGLTGRLKRCERCIRECENIQESLQEQQDLEHENCLITSYNIFPTLAARGRVPKMLPSQ